MNVADIVIGSRARKEAGWLDDLERSIEALGVLQPVGVTPDNDLIFGYRRVMACKNLEIEEIPARVIDVDADDPLTALRMEQHENNVRKDFTASEKVEIARRIEEALAGRQGGDRKSSCKVLQDDPVGNSRDHAAEAVGWSGETYRKAKAVTESGDEDAVKDMDEGRSSVHKAYTETRPNKPESGRTWTLRLNIDSREQMTTLADRIVEEVDETIAVALAERILSRYGTLEVTE